MSDAKSMLRDVIFGVIFFLVIALVFFGIGTFVGSEASSGTVGSADSELARLTKLVRDGEEREGRITAEIEGLRARNKELGEIVGKLREINAGAREAISDSLGRVAASIERQASMGEKLRGVIEALQVLREWLAREPDVELDTGRGVGEPLGDNGGVVN